MNKTALVTGASSGIGKAISEMLVNEGYTVYGIGRCFKDEDSLPGFVPLICDLTDEEIRKIAEIAKEVRPDFIKTSTGFGTSGATVEAVRLMKETVGDAVKVKAAGGIRDWATCAAMIDAGAERIGTSSSAVILEGFDRQRARKE